MCHKIIFKKLILSLENVVQNPFLHNTRVIDPRGGPPVLIEIVCSDPLR